MKIETPKVIGGRNGMRTSYNASSLAMLRYIIQTV